MVMVLWCGSIHVYPFLFGNHFDKEETPDYLLNMYSNIFVQCTCLCLICLCSSLSSCWRHRLVYDV